MKDEAVILAGSGNHGQKSKESNIRRKANMTSDILNKTTFTGCWHLSFLKISQTRTVELFSTAETVHCLRLMHVYHLSSAALMNKT